MTGKRRISGLQRLRHRRQQVERSLAGPLIDERDAAVANAARADHYRREAEVGRRAAERIFATDIGKHVSQEMQHFIAREISQHAMRAAAATVNRLAENGDYVIRIRVPELNIERRFSRQTIDDAPSTFGGVAVRDMGVNSVSIDTARLRHRQTPTNSETPTKDAT